MNTQKEIEEIKARLDRIEAFLSGAATHGGRQTDAQPLYELLDLQVKKSLDKYGSPEYAYRLKVKNSGDAEITFTGYVIFIDSSEFEVERKIIEMFTVPAGETHTQTGQALITDENHAARIADVTAKITPI